MCQETQISDYPNQNYNDKALRPVAVTQDKQVGTLNRKSSYVFQVCPPPPHQNQAT